MDEKTEDMQTSTLVGHIAHFYATKYGEPETTAADWELHRERCAELDRRVPIGGQR